MGTFLRVVGIIAIIIGIIFIITVLGAASGINMIVSGVSLFALGTIYNDVKEIKGKVK